MARCTLPLLDPPPSTTAPHVKSLRHDPPPCTQGQYVHCVQNVHNQLLGQGHFASRLAGVSMYIVYSSTKMYTIGCCLGMAMHFASRLAGVSLYIVCSSTRMYTIIRLGKAILLPTYSMTFDNGTGVSMYIVYSTARMYAISR